MPTTVNGVGTHYYGKSNRSVRTGTCRSCGATANLESYDTRLWFVILFIPIIPLGRKRIMDQCPRCRRHFVADHAKFEMARQLNVSGALDQYRSQATPESALAVHASLLSFHMHGEAEKFRQSALLDHPQSAELRAGLAAHLQQIGRYDESLRMYEAAYELRPDLPEARVGAARVRMGAGKLPEARELLAFLEQPGAGQLYSLEPLEALAIAYQKAGQHEQTLALCKHIVSELPKVGQVAGFRKFVAVSEKALGSTESVLPEKKFSIRQLASGSDGGNPWLRRLTWAAVIAGMVLLVMAGLNEYWRRHRTVIALNECGEPVQMAIDGGPAVTVSRTSKVVLAEGPHHVKISGPIEEEFNIEMATGYFERFGKSPAWVIMPGQGSVLEEETVHYAAANPREGESRLIAGTNFYYAPNIDYCLTAPPQRLQVDNNSSEVTKTCLEVVVLPVHDLIADVAVQDLSAALTFGETRLMHDRDDAQLLDIYVGIAAAAKQNDRAIAYLKRGIDRRPISVPWHRAYQIAAGSDQHEAEIEKEYDALLAKSPQDAGLLYLAGRAATDRKKAVRLYHASHEADPNLPWPCFALAYDFASGGDWPNCRAMAEKAVAQMDYPGAITILHEARVASGDFAALEQEARSKLAANPREASPQTVWELCETLVIQDKSDEARNVYNEWQQRLPPSDRSPIGGEYGRRLIDYMRGDFAAAAGATNEATAKYCGEIQLQSMLAGGRVKEAVADPAMQELLAEPENLLSVSVAWGCAGDSGECAAWREKAAAAWDKLDANYRRAAVMLRDAKPPTASQLNDVVLMVQQKSVLLAALMQRFPDHQAELAPLARKLNIGRRPPYHLVQKVIDDSSAAPRKAAVAP